MTEAQVGFLFNAAAKLQQHHTNPTITKLRSYYLMRCIQITKGYGLPDRHFSTKARCTRCCVEWRSDTKIGMKPMKLSKKQRRRLQTKKLTKKSKDWIEKSKTLLHSNELEQTCTFCSTVTKTIVPKPEKFKSHKIVQPTTINITDKTDSKAKKELLTMKTAKNIKIERTFNKEAKSVKPDKDINNEINVYNQTKDVFSLKNDSNTITSAIKVKAKVIKNNKKKKDKFAGLCATAVLATAKLKEDAQKLKADTQKHNKLGMFLKPSK